MKKRRTWKKRSSGVYQIRNTNTDKIYVGSAVNFSERRGKHKYYLKKGTHHSIHLQRSWEKHGIDAFRFEVLEIVENLDQLVEREQHYLDTLKPFDDNGYNICRVANNCRGVPCSEKQRQRLSEMFSGTGNPFYGKTHTKESKRKMSEAKKGLLVGEKNPMFGKDFSAEKNPSAKITWADVGFIREEYSNGESAPSIASEVNISTSSVYEIVHNNQWVDPDYDPPPKQKRLTDEERQEIRKRYSQENVLQKELAEHYGVAGSTISKVVNN